MPSSRFSQESGPRCGCAGKSQTRKAWVCYNSAEQTKRFESNVSFDLCPRLKECGTCIQPLAARLRFVRVPSLIWKSTRAGVHVMFRGPWAVLSFKGVGAVARSKGVVTTSKKHFSLGGCPAGSMLEGR